ncbi:hypothetical protein GLOIN_2v1479259 [Rhizophagus irregularis DAOM 181602=DAOM 197198]|uniref:Uncharacterized protein n=1 Tax=Rhizophagus irregularis (strain DAOM 181602 / DAOM 197198 / MUCL 43194) TaxID=747089 RepID=A0A2P4PYH4_RHIID|nr:hypothetical protein GLOIN_2v1479259 [Rhizophagus irregularis DAOM 181602=DAOM 197198]POG70441.1 hypothetical protein GLOIN_2v1479259 [Rhizophagus irregularis DAOM 181602=DAOM 197198]|eukprot:XP_025177307.1 hypothetical protein GLOIN_2v1479259 [Rhizophagus irregularis DAOM 181602=DAOM 197198]
MSLQRLLLLKNLKVRPPFFYKFKPSSIPIDRRYYFNPTCNGINRKECVCFNSVETRSNHWSPNDDYGEDGNLLETFKKIIFHSDTEIQDFLNLVQGKGFVEIINAKSKKLPIEEKPPSIVNIEMQDNLRLLNKKQKFSAPVTSNDSPKKEKIKERGDVSNLACNLQSIENFKHYRIEFHFISKIKYESTWTEKEDKAMKEETLLAIMEALNKYETDKILIAGERMYLVEAEHNITLENINNIADEIKEFKKLKKNDVSSEYHELLDKLMIEGIICGVNFPEEFRKMAKDRGLFSVYPGGGRYKKMN